MSVCLSVRPSVCLSAWNNSAPTGRIFMKFDIGEFFENLSIKFEFHLNLTRITGTLHEDEYTFLTICSLVLFSMKNISYKSRENQNTQFIFSNFFSCFENRAVYKIMWKNIVESGQATDDNMAHVHCMLHTQVYQNTLRICNINCLSTATVVGWTRLIFTS